MGVGGVGQVWAFPIQDLENTSYTALVSDGSSDHQVKVDISE